MPKFYNIDGFIVSDDETGIIYNLNGAALQTIGGGPPPPTVDKFYTVDGVAFRDTQTAIYFTVDGIALQTLDDGTPPASIGLTGPDNITEGVTVVATGTALDTATSVVLKSGGFSKTQTIAAQTETTLDYVAESGYLDCIIGTPASGIPINGNITAAGITPYTVEQEVSNGGSPVARALAAAAAPGFTVIQTMAGVANTTPGESLFGSTIIVVEDDMLCIAPINPGTSTITYLPNGTYISDKDETNVVTMTYWSPSTGQYSCHTLTMTASSISAAVISAPGPTGTLVTPTTADVIFTTDQINGTGYTSVDTPANMSGVSEAQLKLGQNAFGNPAVASGNIAVPGLTITIQVTGLTEGTDYEQASVQENGGGDSNIVSSQFSTFDIVNGPVLTNGLPIGDIATLTNAIITCDTTNNTGTFYVVVDIPDDIVGVDAQSVKDGENSGSQPALASSNITVTDFNPAIDMTGLPSNMRLSAAMVHEDGDDSNVLIVTFTTAIAISNPAPIGTIATPTSVTISCVSTGLSGGTHRMYVVFDQPGNLDNVTEGQIKAGQNNSSVPAQISGNNGFTTLAPSVDFTTLTPSTAFDYAIVVGNGTDSNILAGSLTTSAAFPDVIGAEVTGLINAQPVETFGGITDSIEVSGIIDSGGS